MEGGFRLRGVARGWLLTSGYRRGTRRSWCVGGGDSGWLVRATGRSGRN